MCVSGKNIDNAFLIFISTFFYLWQEYTASIHTSIMIHKNVIALKIVVLPESFGPSDKHNIIGVGCNPHIIITLMCSTLLSRTMPLAFWEAFVCS